MTAAPLDLLTATFLVCMGSAVIPFLALRGLEWIEIKGKVLFRPLLVPSSAV